MQVLNYADSLKNRLELNIWVSVIRFVYVISVFVSIYLLNGGFKGDYKIFSITNIAFLLVVVLGVFITIISYSVSVKTENYKIVKYLSIFQVILDFAVIFCLYKFVMSSQTGLYILYFIPMLYSIILFKYLVPMLLGLLSIIFISNFFIYGVPANILTHLPLYIIGGLIISGISAMIKSQRKAAFMQSKELELATKAMSEMERITKAQELEIAEVEGRLDNFDHAKSDFVTLTTHELRTPLSAINWSLDIIKSEKDPEIISSTVDKAQASVKRMNKLIDRIIVLGKDVDVNEKFDFSKIDLIKLINEVKDELIGSADERGVKVSFNLKDIPMIDADAARLRIVLEELIQNAIVYTPRGGEVVIDIDSSKLNSVRNSIDIIVSDNGIGIKEEEKEKIFQRFYRGDGAMQVETDGTGLGLYMAREIVQKHQGTIWFSERPSGGTSFHVELPVNQNKK